MWWPFRAVAWHSLVLAALVAGPRSARAVRLGARWPPEAANGIGAKTRQPLGETEGSPLVLEQNQRQVATHVPSLDKFQELWARLGAEDKSTVPAGRLPSMVVGIFTTLNGTDAQYRKVIRSTWMQHPAVCTVADRELKRAERTANCSIFVAFVAGRDPDGVSTTDPAEEEDVVVLPIEENMNHGKTLAWFDWAAEKYPWATHIAKMDMDAFVHVSGLLAHMRDASGRCPHVYGGIPHSMCSVAFRKLYGVEAGHGCWNFMYGGFYYLSRELATNASKASALWRSLRTQVVEDVLTGYALHMYTKEHGLCLTSQSIKRDVKHLR